MSSDVIRISPDRLRYKLEDVSDLEAPVWAGDWDRTRLSPLAAADKHRAIVQRYRDGQPWEATDLFRNVYAGRLEREPVRGCASLEALAAQYYDRVDGLFAHLRRHGFRDRVDGMPVKIPDVYLGRDGEVILGNDGNHRVAMAKLLGLPSILVRVRTRHPEATLPAWCHPVTLDPVLPPGTDDIPAMTTPAERFTGYELAKSAGGVVVELGAWLGAMTAYLAAGVRDAGAPPMHTFDRFAWKPVHTIKAGGPLVRPMREQFEQNLGPLLPHVEIHAGDFRDATWNGTPIGLLVLDGPKRVRELTRTLPIFGGALRPGSRMAWQDFAHFASYDLPASLETLERAGVVRWERGVYPGTMGVFEVLRPIAAADVSADRLRLDRWTPEAIASTWDRWAERIPAGQWPRFSCGAALFLCDRGFVDLGTARFRGLLRDFREDVAGKWLMIRETRPEFARRYPTLDAEVGPWNA